MKKLTQNINKYSIGLFLAFALFLTSCSMSSPGMATRNPVGNKIGVASANYFLSIPPFKADLSIKKAAENGGITKVATVDYKVEGKIFSTTYSTIVTGE